MMLVEQNNLTHNNKNISFRQKNRIFIASLGLTFLGTVITINIALPLFFELFVGGDFLLQDAFAWNLFLTWESLKAFLLIVAPLTIIASWLFINRVTQRFSWWQEHPKELGNWGMWQGAIFFLVTSLLISIIWNVWGFLFLGFWVVLGVPCLLGAVWGSLMVEMVFHQLQKS